MSGIGTATKVSSATKPALPLTPGSCVTGVHEINPLGDSRWEAFIEGDPRASVFHSIKWLKALQTTYGYDPLVITTCSPDAALSNGLVFCRIDSWLTGRRFVSLPFSDHCEPLVTDSTELENLLLHMRRYVDAGKCRYVEIRPIACWPGSPTGLGKSVTYSLHRLDLRSSTDELFRKFHKDCVQRKIRRAEREKLHYEDGNTEALLSKFYDLLVVTRRRQCLPPQPLSWFRALVVAFGEDLKIRVAYKNGLAIASILTLSYKKSMVYKYGGSDVRFHKLGGMALLFWNAIREAKNKGITELEMGRSDRSNLGLLAFKDHWGATSTELSYWKYPHKPGAYIYRNERQNAALKRLVPITPNFILKAAGSILYRHMG